MLKSEAILLDPSPGEIAERLADAAAAANKRCRTRLLADDPAKWRKFARQTQAAPEGFDLFRGGKGGVPGTHLVAAWWTDHIGRKHVVFRGRRIEHDDAKILLDKAALAARPPLWHCYPQYLYQRFRPTDGEPLVDWIAVCGCGAVGTPDALGWMGETCGPCHDRREEGSDLRGNRPGWLHGVRNPFLAVAFSRDGTKVAAMEDHGPIGVWTLTDADKAVRLEPPDTAPSGPLLTVQPLNPILAFVGEADEYLYVPTVHDERVGTCIYDLRKPIDLLAFTNWDWDNPEEDFLFATCPTRSPTRTLAYATHSLELWTAFPDLELLQSDILGPGFWLNPPAAPAPSHLVLISTDGLRLFPSEAPTERVFIPYRPNSGSEHHVYHRHRAAYHEPTRTVFVGRHNELEVYDLDRRQYVKVLRTVNSPHAKLTGPNAPILALAVSVDQRHLFLLTWDRVVVFDAVTHAAVAAFAWHLGPIRALAVSPDGRTLATIGVEGVVKLWPIDRLLSV